MANAKTTAPPTLGQGLLLWSVPLLVIAGMLTRHAAASTTEAVVASIPPMLIAFVASIVASTVANYLDDGRTCFWRLTGACGFAIAAATVNGVTAIVVTGVTMGMRTFMGSAIIGLMLITPVVLLLLMTARITSRSLALGFGHATASTTVQSALTAMLIAVPHLGMAVPLVVTTATMAGIGLIVTLTQKTGSR